MDANELAAKMRNGRSTSPASVRPSSLSRQEARSRSPTAKTSRENSFVRKVFDPYRQRSLDKDDTSSSHRTRERSRSCDRSHRSHYYRSRSRDRYNRHHYTSRLPKSETPCRFFLTVGCRFGSTCRFKHSSRRKRTRSRSSRTSRKSRSLSRSRRYSTPRSLRIRSKSPRQKSVSHGRDVEDKESCKILPQRPASLRLDATFEDDDSTSPSPIKRPTPSPPPARRSPSGGRASLAESRPTSPAQSKTSSRIKQRPSRSPSPYIQKAKSSTKKKSSSSLSRKKSEATAEEDQKYLDFYGNLSTSESIQRKKISIQSVDEELAKTDARIARKIKELELLEVKCRSASVGIEEPTETTLSPNPEPKDRKAKSQRARAVQIRSNSIEKKTTVASGNEAATAGAKTTELASMEAASSSLIPTIMKSQWSRRRERSWSEDSNGKPKPGSRQMIVMIKYNMIKFHAFAFFISITSL